MEGKEKPKSNMHTVNVQIEEIVEETEDDSIEGLIERTSCGIQIDEVVRDR